MGLPWLRLYAELKDDPKVGALSDSEFRLYIESLCWACQVGDNGRLGLTVENASWAFRRDVSTSLQALFRAGLLLSKEDGIIAVHNWNRRQRDYDLSTERTRTWRRKRKTFPKRSRNVPETETERHGNGIEESRGEEIREVPPVSPKLNGDMAKLIPELHREYCRSTGLEVSLNMDRERAWFEWIKQGFQKPDIDRAVQYLRQNTRDAGILSRMLAFDYLIGRPDRFEEAKAAAKAKVRPESVNPCY